MSSHPEEGGLTDKPKDLQYLVPGEGYTLLTCTCRRSTPWLYAELKGPQRSSRPTRCTHRESKVQRGQVDGATLHSCLVVGQARPAPNGPPIGWIISGSTAAKAGQRGIYLPGPSLILVLVPGRASRSLDTRWIPGPWAESSPFPAQGLQASRNWRAGSLKSLLPPPLQTWREPRSKETWMLTAV